MICIICNKNEEAHNKLFHPFIPAKEQRLAVYKLEYTEGYNNLFGIFICDQRIYNLICDKEVYLGEVSGKHSEVSVVISDACEFLTDNKDAIYHVLEYNLTVGIDPVIIYMERLNDQEEINYILEEISKID